MLSRCNSPTFNIKSPNAIERGKSLLSRCFLYAKSAIARRAIAKPALDKLKTSHQKP
jgi:hypothetical protein